MTIYKIIPTGQTLTIPPNDFPPAPDGWSSVTLYKDRDGKFYAIGLATQNGNVYYACYAEWHTDHWDIFGQTPNGDTIVTGHWLETIKPLHRRPNA